MTVERKGAWVYVDGEDREKRWSFPDPSLASAGECASALTYLLLLCPTTTDAQKKLADMRRALRASPAPVCGEGQEAPTCLTCDGAGSTGTRLDNGKRNPCISCNGTGCTSPAEGAPPVETGPAPVCTTCGNHGGYFLNSNDWFLCNKRGVANVRGTRHTLDIAIKQGKPVKIFRDFIRNQVSTSDRQTEANCRVPAGGNRVEDSGVVIKGVTHDAK